jgi:hypothetical protein
MTIQERMAQRLSETGIPAKHIHCYGSQIVVTCFAREAAERFASVLAQFAKVRGIIEMLDDAVVNKNTALKPSKVKVVRVFAAV